MDFITNEFSSKIWPEQVRRGGGDGGEALEEKGGGAFRARSTRSVLGKCVYLVTLAMSLFDLQDVRIAIGSIATLDLPMVVDLIGIYGLKGPYCTLTTTNWFLQALSVIPRGLWGDVARRFTMIRWAIVPRKHITATPHIPQHRFSHVHAQAALTTKTELEIQRTAHPNVHASRRFANLTTRRHKALHVPPPALIQGSKWVANERAKQGGSSATKIVKNRGWMRWESAMENHGEQ
ncbi:plasma membrane ATPase 1-like [Dorcoceras hygrometricum]|uniref:Plasma membrane ATPase 1-like n=1 Tax=Dorcoceras hygrometricum TaxID=472368 RepID=A0A2Z7B0I3_9LAMI|nr:plasma membrane ATPase 1-like [Dorcoceras hygrometricum]